MGWHVSFQFDLAAGATLNQDFNVDFPTFGTAKGFEMTISSKSGSATLLQLGTVNSTISPVTDWQQYAHQRFSDTGETRTWSEPRFSWNYLNQEIELRVTNLSENAETYFVTCSSDEP